MRSCATSTAGERGLEEKILAIAAANDLVSSQGPPDDVDRGVPLAIVLAETDGADQDQNLKHDDKRTRAP
jgi:hypothetical protein